MILNLGEDANSISESTSRNKKLLNLDYTEIEQRIIAYYGEIKMRNKIEEFWKELEGKILHIQIKGVYPDGENNIAMGLEILEIGEHFTVDIDTTEK